MRLRKATALAGLAFSSPALAATSEQWRGRSVYQVLTDRFARTDGSTDATCNTSDRLYCGGTFKGIESVSGRLSANDSQMLKQDAAAS